MLSWSPFCCTSQNSVLLVPGSSCNVIFELLFGSVIHDYNYHHKPCFAHQPKIVEKFKCWHNFLNECDQIKCSRCRVVKWGGHTLNAPTTPPTCKKDPPSSQYIVHQHVQWLKSAFAAALHCIWAHSNATHPYSTLIVKFSSLQYTYSKVQCTSAHFTFCIFTCVCSAQCAL